MEKIKESAKKAMPSKKVLMIIGVILLLIVVSFVVYRFGFQYRGAIQSPEDVSEAVTGIGSGIEDIGSILEDIDKSLG